jgi:nifR3 family TIM-barrel protein
MNFWQQLKKQKDETGQPFFALAPMADVTDPAFRLIVAKYGKPDVLWTEFVSADGLAHPVAREKLIRDLAYSESERPLVAQLFSSNPENMRSACKLCAELGFDGIDINMGCPDKTIEKQGCGSAMIKTPDIAVQIINAAKQGIAEAENPPAGGIPLSVKTRVGYSTDEIDTWIRTLLMQNLAALTVHARTRKDLSKVPANWNYIDRVVKLRNVIAPDTVIIGNGDVSDMADGTEKARDTGCDGIMIGRAIFGNPWLFNKNVNVIKRGSWRRNFLVQLLPDRWAKHIMGESRYTISDIPLSDKLHVMIEQTELFNQLLGDIKNFAVMKKHYKAYATGFPGAKELRIALMESKNIEDVKGIVNDFLKESKNMKY